VQNARCGLSTGVGSFERQRGLRHRFRAIPLVASSAESSEILLRAEARLCTKIIA